MNKNVLIGFGVVLAIILAGPFVKQYADMQRAMKAAPAKGGGEPAAPIPNDPPLLNAGNLPGSVWTIQGFNIEILAGGQAQATGTPLGTITGTWSVNGADMTVTASVMGQTRTITLKIAGNNIYTPEGKPIQRVR